MEFGTSYPTIKILKRMKMKTQIKRFPDLLPPVVKNNLTVINVLQFFATKYFRYKDQLIMKESAKINQPSINELPIKLKIKKTIKPKCNKS